MITKPKKKRSRPKGEKPKQPIGYGSRTPKTKSQLKQENHALRESLSQSQELVFKQKSQINSLIRLFHSKVDEKAHEERAKLVEREKDYRRLMENFCRKSRDLEEQLERFDALRAAYIARFGEIEVAKIEKNVTGAAICPRCNGLGGAHDDCPLCSGSGWINS